MKSEKSEKGENLGRGQRVGQSLLINWTGVPLFSPTFDQIISHPLPTRATFDQISWARRERAARFRSFSALHTNIHSFAFVTVGRITKKSKDGQNMLLLVKPCGVVN